MVRTSSRFGLWIVTGWLGATSTAGWASASATAVVLQTVAAAVSSGAEGGSLEMQREPRVNSDARVVHINVERASSRQNHEQTCAASIVTMVE